MNFAGHIAVARLGQPGTEPSRAFLLGAALPDLAAMGRFRLTERPSDPDLAGGVEFHHRTDDVFHRHPWFRTASGSVSKNLEAQGVARGAARACGHVGVELLLDGHLLQHQGPLRASVRAAIDNAEHRADDLRDLVAPADRPAWQHHLLRVAGWPVPDDYHQPDAVAHRLQRILARRPRLALPKAQTQLVASALEHQQISVTEGAGPLLDDLVRELTAPG